MNEAKKKILARRAQFIAAAIAGLGATSCGKDAHPRPCLEPMYSPPDPDAAPSPVEEPMPDASLPPQPCLKIVPK